MGSSRFLLFFFFVVCSVALLEAAAVAPQKKTASAAKEEVVVITTPEVHAAAAAPSDRSEEVIAALREEIGRKDKKVSTLEAQLHALEAKLKTASGAPSPAVGGGNGNPEKLRSLEETVRTQQIEIKSLKEEVASLKKTAGAGASASLGSALEWLEKEYNTQVEKHLPKDWKEKLQENSEAKLAALSYFLRNDLRPLLLQHKQTALLKAQEALEQVENRVEEQLQLLYGRYPTALPAAAKTARVGRYVAYGLGLLVSIVGALLLWKVLGLLLIVIIVLITLPFRLLSLIFGGKKKPAQPQASGKKKKKNAAAASAGRE